ncbi:hypothetical protein [Deinococcus sonorensis]|uniref:DUF4412 domain-containing protein n=2 Tax=Deinococcus sonorensis TaxID=309891 RepID=A0AAU7U7C4_9DEIO
MKLLPVFVALGLAFAPPASALGIQGQLANPAVVSRLMGSSSGVYVFLTSVASGTVAGLAPLTGDHFYLQVPDTQPRRLAALEICDGPTLSAHPRVYQAETMLLYSKALNRVVGPLIQADDPANPSRTVRWMYSDRAAAIQGQCRGLSTRYDLTLRQGWNAVMTVNDDARLTYSNARQRLPYWVQGNLTLNNARSVLPAGFFNSP